MSQQSFNMGTVSGHDLGEVTSALQKSIRRGDERNALYWASEMDLSGFGNHCWKRLRVIASEDVGLGEPNIAANIHALYTTWKDFMDKKEKNAKLNPDRMFLCHAVLLLCRAQKSRIIDSAMSCYWKFHPQFALPIPDVALDKHTLRGKRMGRGWDHFFDEGTKLENRSGLADEYEADFRRLASSK